MTLITSMYFVSTDVAPGSALTLPNVWQGTAEPSAQYKM
jgi:hypothetical protein